MAKIARAPAPASEKAQLYLTRTPALAELRSLLWQANRELVTVLAGLDAIRAGRVDAETEQLPWTDEESRLRAVRHARRFVNDAALGRLVDAIDAYLAALRREGAFATAVPTFAAQERSVKARLEALAEELEVECTMEMALAHLAIQWRNRRLHSGASNRLEQRYVARLRDGDEGVGDRLGGLDPTRLLEHFECSRSPRPRELLALARATDALAGQLDRSLVLATDPMAYAVSAVGRVLRAARDGAEAPDRPRLESVWTQPPEKRRGRLEHLLRSLGFHHEPLSEEHPPLAPEWLDDLSRASQREAAARFGLLEERKADREDRNRSPDSES